MAYEDLSFDELNREIRREEDEIEGLRAEQSKISTEFYDEIRREEDEVRRLRDEYYRVSREIADKTASLEATETILFSTRARISELRRDRERARSRYRYWRSRRRTARTRRLRLERQRRRELLKIRRDIIRLERLRRGIEEAKRRERDAEARYRRELRAYRTARDEVLSLRREIRDEERELKRLRKEIERLPDPTDILSRIRETEREIERKPDRLDERLKEIDKQIEEIETELEKKREALAVYSEWEFSKYYKYRSAKAYRRRHFEIRATFTLPRDVDPEKVKDVVEEKFDDVMLALGIDPALFTHGWVAKGAEKVGQSKTFNRTVEAVVEDKTRGFVWSYPGYPTQIDVSESEVTA